jgi:Glycosyl transferases group 1
MTNSDPVQEYLGPTDRGGFPSAGSEAETPADPVKRPRFGFVYDSQNTHITAQSLREAAAEDQITHFDLGLAKPDADIQQFLRLASRPERAPDLILHETGAPGLPRGLHQVSIPTALLDIDTFGWTFFRLQWALLFDYVFTWHPCYVRAFEEAGHPRVFVLPHAVDAAIFGEVHGDQERLYDLGFVGNVALSQYSRRDRVITHLAKLHRTNDCQRSYGKKDMAQVYKRSKIVVNVSRSEFPQEANMRCYEAMAGGALLITGIPTELTEWGFREGEHFIGWRSEQEIPALVERFLHHSEQRATIARAGQERTLRSFTYQQCIDRIAAAVAKGNGGVFAPARGWPPEDIHLLYLSYYYRYRLHCAALEEFRLLRRANPRAYWKGFPMAAKTLRHAVSVSLM